MAAGKAVYAAVPTTDPGTLAFAPVVDGVLLPEAPITVLRAGRGIPVPLMIGTNKDERSYDKSLGRFIDRPDDDAVQMEVGEAGHGVSLGLIKTTQGR